MPLPGFSCLCHSPAFLVYVISRRSSLSVIARLDRAICLRLRLSRFRILRSSRSMTGWNNNIISRRTPQHHFLTFSSLCHCSTFSSTSHYPTSFLFMSLPDLIGQSNSLSSGIYGFSPCHPRLFSLSSTAFLSVIIRLDRAIHAAEYHFLCHLLSRPPGEA